MFDLFDSYEDIDPDLYDYDDDSEETRVARDVEAQLERANSGLWVRPDVTFMDGWGE